MRSFLREGTLVFAGLVLANTGTYLFYALVARTVGVEATGLFTALISVILVGTVPATVGATVVAKIAADARGRGEMGVLAWLGIAAAWSLLPVGAIAFAIATLFGPLINSFFHVGDPVVIALAITGFALTFVLAPQRAVLQGGGAFTAYAVSNVTEGVSKALTGYACWAVGGGLRVALGGYVLATLAAFGFNTVLARLRRVVPSRPRLPAATVVRHLVGIALPISAITVVTFADVVLVRHYLDAHASGLYGATALVGRALLTVMQFVPAVLMPRAAAEHAAGRPSKRFFLAACAVTATVVGVTAVAAALFPTAIVTAVAGRAFAEAAPLVLPYTLAMGALTGATVFASYLIGIDRLGFAVPLAVVACAEVASIALVHPDAATVVRIVVAGHLAAFLCCLFDALASLRGPQGLARAIAEVRPS